jgi:alanyl-tRNA synthetase
MPRGCHDIHFVCLNLQTIDPAPIPAAQKAALRDQLASLQKRVLEGQKKAAAANKQRATQAAVADADKAVSAGQKFGVMRVDVGLDPKALLEAWNAIQKQHPKLPVIMFSTDQGKTGLWQSALGLASPGGRFADFGATFCEFVCDGSSDFVQT